MSRPLCTKCNHNLGMCQRRRGREYFYPLCWTCYRGSSQPSHRRRYQKSRELVCDECGFVALHICQIDVDHIDGDHSNNFPENLRSLCANCHRLKTWIERDTVLGNGG